MIEPPRGRNQHSAVCSPEEAERIVFAALAEAARCGAGCPTAEELVERIPDGSLTRTVNIVRRLEERGLIAVRRYQRGRQVTILATGESTRPLPGAAAHWRDRPRNIPAPAPDPLRRRDPDTFLGIQRAAARERRVVAEFLADLVWLGWAAYLQDKDDI